MATYRVAICIRWAVGIGSREPFISRIKAMWSQVVVALVLLAVFTSSGFVLYKRRHAKVEPAYFQYKSHSTYVRLFGFRALAVTFFVATLTNQLYTSKSFDIYAFYTVWNFTAQLVYFAWVLKVQWNDWTSHHAGSLLVTREHYILNTLFDVVFANSLLIATFYWAFVYKYNLNRNIGVTWPTVAEHGINTFLLMIEFCLNHHETQWSNLVFASFLWPGTYSLVLWIFRMTWLDVWPYPFLDTTKAEAPAWYLVLILFHVIFFSMTIGASKLKQRFHPVIFITKQDINVNNYASPRSSGEPLIE